MLQHVQCLLHYYCYFSISARRPPRASGRWFEPAFTSTPPAAAVKGRSSSMIRGFCIPFSPRMFSIAPSKVTEGTFNYSLWLASAQPVLIVGRQPHPRRMEIREAVFYSIFYFFLEILLRCPPAASPWHLLTFPLQRRVCPPDYEEQIFSESKWKTGRKIRASALRLTRGCSPSTINRPTQQLAGLRKKSTRRSHYCPPSSVFTGMLKIVITSVRTDISNLDVFVEGLRPSCGEGRQSQREAGSGTTDERWNRIWTEMRTGSARSCSINRLQFGIRNFCYTHWASVNNFSHVFMFSVAVWVKIITGVWVMTVNTKLQEEGEGEFPKAQSALAHAGRSVQELQNETGFVVCFLWMVGHCWA